MILAVVLEDVDRTRSTIRLERHLGPEGELTIRSPLSSE
jgi:hypothetical protein